MAEKYQSILNAEQKKQLTALYIELQEQEKVMQQKFIDKILEPNNKYLLFKGNGYELYPCLFEIVSFAFHDNKNFYFNVVKHCLTRTQSNEIIVEHFNHTQHSFTLDSFDLYLPINAHQYENIVRLIYKHKEMIDKSLDEVNNYFRCIF